MYVCMYVCMCVCVCVFFFVTYQGSSVTNNLTCLPTVGYHASQQYRSGERIHGDIQLRLPSNDGIRPNTPQYINIYIYIYIHTRTHTYIALHSMDPKSVKITVGYGISHTATKIHITYNRTISDIHTKM
jgi:hypothetical protein